MCLLFLRVVGSRKAAGVPSGAFRSVVKDLYRSCEKRPRGRWNVPTDRSAGVPNTVDDASWVMNNPHRPACREQRLINGINEQSGNAAETA